MNQFLMLALTLVIRFFTGVTLDMGQVLEVFIPWVLDNTLVVEDFFYAILVRLATEPCIAWMMQAMVSLVVGAIRLYTGLMEEERNQPWAVQHPIPKLGTGVHFVNLVPYWIGMRASLALLWIVVALSLPVLTGNFSPTEAVWLAGFAGGIMREAEMPKEELSRKARKRLIRHLENLSEVAERLPSGEVDTATTEGRRMVEIVGNLRDTTVSEWVPDTLLPWLKWVTASQGEKLNFRIVSIKENVGEKLRTALDFPDDVWGVRPSLVIPGKDGTRIVYVKGFNEGIEAFLRDKCGLEVDGSNVIKTAKRLKRLFLRPDTHSRVLGWKNISWGRVNLPKKVHSDGCEVVISRRFARRLGVRKYIERCSVTLLCEYGLLKGHALIEERGVDGTDITFYYGGGESPFKPEVKWPGGRFYIGLDPVKASEDVMMDLQSMISFWPSLRHIIGIMAAHGFRHILDQWRAGELGKGLAKVDLLADPSSCKYSFQEYQRRGGDYRTIPYFRKAVWNMTLKRRRQMEWFRIPIIAARRVYAVVDLSLPAGVVKVDGPNLWVSGDDAEGMFLRHGGADQDDSFVLIPMPGGKVFIYRNPNQVGEWSVKILDPNSSWVPERTWDIRPEELSVKEGRPSEPEVEEVLSVATDIVADTIIGVVRKTRPYDRRGVKQAQANLEKLAGEIAAGSNHNMVAAAILFTFSLLTPEQAKFILEHMEELEIIIDAESKLGNSPAVESQRRKRRAFWKFLAKERIPVPEFLLDRVPRGVRNLISTYHSEMDDLVESVKGYFERTEELVAQEVDDSYAGIPSSLLRVDDIPSVVRSIAVGIISTWRKGVREIEGLRANLLKDCETKEDHELLDEQIREEYRKLKATVNQMVASSRRPLQVVRMMWSLIYDGALNYADAVLWIDDSATEAGYLHGTAHYSMRMMEKAGLLHSLHSSECGTFITDGEGFSEEEEAADVVIITVGAGLKQRGASPEEVIAWSDRVLLAVEGGAVVKRSGKSLYLLDDEGPIGSILEKDASEDDIMEVVDWELSRNEFTVRLIGKKG